MEMVQFFNLTVICWISPLTVLPPQIFLIAITARPSHLLLKVWFKRKVPMVSHLTKGILLGKVVSTSKDRQLMSFNTVTCSKPPTLINSPPTSTNFPLNTVPFPASKVISTTPLFVTPPNPTITYPITLISPLPNSLVFLRVCTAGLSFIRCYMKILW